MERKPDTRLDTTGEPTADPRPRYEPPRITKRRSVRRATLATGGATAQAEGIITNSSPP